MPRVLFLVLLVVFSPVSADARSIYSGNDNSKVQVLRGRFTFEKSIKDGAIRKTEHGDGYFVVAPGLGVIWAVETPQEIKMIFTNNSILGIVQKKPAFMVSEKKMPSLPRVYAMLADGLKGMWEAFNDDFTVERSGDENNWQVKMSARNRNAGVPFTLITASGGKFVTAVGLVEPSGTYSSYKIVGQEISEITDEERRTIDNANANRFFNP